MEEALAEPNCCVDSTCTRIEMSRLLTPEDPIEQRVHETACAVAATCPGLNAEGLQSCFSKLFDTQAECRLFRLFQSRIRRKGMVEGKVLLATYPVNPQA